MTGAAAAVEDLPAGFACLGFSNGGGMATYVATKLPVSRVVLCSGALPLSMIGVDSWPAGVSAQLHYARDDPFRTVGQVENVADSVTASGGQAEAFCYPGTGHLFTDASLPSEYDATSRYMLADRQVKVEWMTKQFDDEDVARLRIALARIARLVDRQVSGDGMTRTQLSVLGTVARLGTVPVSELAEIEGLNPTMLSRLIGKLEVAELVTRAPDTTDRRAVQVGITDAGTALHQRLRRERTRLFAERLELLPGARAAELVHALPALEELAEQMRRPDDSAARIKAGAR